MPAITPLISVQLKKNENLKCMILINVFVWHKGSCNCLPAFNVLRLSVTQRFANACGAVSYLTDISDTLNPYLFHRYPQSVYLW